MRENENKKRNYIIIGLCAVVAIMVVGFAAFSQQLQINSTSEVSSLWDVHIKDNGVSYKNAVEATSTLAEKTSALVATFACTLSTPGTSTISYDIIVENKGTLNAKLDSIELTGGNTAISVVTSPTNASLATTPIVLAPDDETTITVIVSYNDILTQPTGDGAQTSITAKLNFSQTNDSPSGGGGGGASSTETVYAFPSQKCLNSECINTQGYSNTITDGVSNYTQLLSYQNGVDWFMKFEIDSTTNVIQNAWTCMKFSMLSAPICLKGATDTRYYNDNMAILTALSNNSTFTNNDGSCNLGSDESFPNCGVGSESDTSSIRYIKVSKNSGEVESGGYECSEQCKISYNGLIKCEI